MKILVANAPAIEPLENGFENYFVRAGSRWPFSVRKKRNTPLSSYIPFPFYLAYTVSLLRDKRYDVEGLDAIPLNWDHEEFIEYVLKVRPTILLLESTTPTIEMDIKIIKALKTEIQDLKVAISGSHVTTFPEETLKRYPEIDFIFRGEYEVPFVEFIQEFQAKNGNKSDLKKELTSICYLDNEGNYIEGSKGIIQDLDALPFPAWDDFPIKGKNPWNFYWDNICQLTPAAQMHASRGCPFRCDFCVWIQVMYDNSRFRPFSPKRIVDEMEELIKRYKVKEIYFDDDIFTGNKQHVLDFCHEITRRQLKIKWSIMGDAMVCDEEMVEEMAKAGLVAMKFGVESGDSQVLKEIGKPLKLEKVKSIVKKCNQMGVKTHATFSFGASGETKETMQKTFQVMNQLNVDTLQTSITTPFPGTRFYDKMKEKGYLKSPDWNHYDGANSAVVSYPHLDHLEIESFAKTAKARWLRKRLLSPSWVLRQVKITFRIFFGQGILGTLRFFKEGLRIFVKG